MTIPKRGDLPPPQQQFRRSRFRRFAAAGMMTVSLLSVSILELAFPETTETAAAASAPACFGDNGRLMLPSGFCATVFADNIGRARHIVVAANGVVYANTSGGVVALEDTIGNGRANIIHRFGNEAGGIGIAIFRGRLYAETADRIVRYDLSAGRIAPSTSPETVVSHLPSTGKHPFAIDAEGGLFLASGSAANSGASLQGGVWRYDANRTDQTFSPAGYFVDGIRDADAVSIEHGITDDSIGLGIYVTEHRRLKIPGYPEQEAAFPAARLLKVSRTEKPRSLALFPGQWVPSDLLLYDRRQFPAQYSGGAFIAFSASRPNGAPFSEGSGAVMFQPFANGKPAGKLKVFAKGSVATAGKPVGAAWHPSGLALGPDGALYIGDDLHGRIWRVTYRGPVDQESAAKS